MNKQIVLTDEELVSEPLPTVKNPLNAHRFIVIGEVNSQPSMTVPDQSLSIKEILDRHARGLPISGNIQIPVYDEEDDMPDIRTLDLAERQEMAQKYANELIELRKTQAEEYAKKQAKRADYEARIRKLIEKEESEQDDDSTNIP